MKGNDWKEKVKTIFRLRFLLPVSLGAVLAAVILRIVQLNVAVDFATGFFIEHSVWVPLLAALLVLFALYAIGQTACNLFPPVNPYEGHRLKPIGIAAMLLGVVMIASGFVEILTSAGTGSATGLLQYLVILLEIAAGGVFLYQGFLLLQQAAEKLQSHVLMLVPAVWSVVSLMVNFIAHTTIAGISEYLFDILFDAAAVLFLFYFARFTAGLWRKRQEQLMLLFGLLTVMLGAVSTVPPLFCKLFEWNRIGRRIAFPDFSALFLTVFVGWCLFLFVQSWLRAESPTPNKQMPADLDCEYRYETVGIEGLFQK